MQRSFLLSAGLGLALLVSSTLISASIAAPQALAPRDAPERQAATEQPTRCDMINFTGDITIPDGSIVEAGERFIKVWRLTNGGTCTWTTGYALVFVGGEQMSAPGVMQLPMSVAPGQSIDVSVPMEAPIEDGHYRGDWMLRNGSGVLFGVAEDNIAFWVEINVGLETPTVTATESATPTVPATATAAPAAPVVPTRTPPPPPQPSPAPTPTATVTSAPAPDAPIRFRPGGPVVPEITTSIPTPLDISTEPAVLGANLSLAAGMMLPFALAAEWFTHMLADYEESLRRRNRPAGWLARLQRRAAAIFGAPLRRNPAWRDLLRLVAVMAFYGLAFSLLDRTWRPFTWKGLALFLSMAIAYGIVGIADDVMQWRAIRRWKLPADLTVRPTNILLAVASTGLTRLFSLVPGLMFGTPEALQFDEGILSRPQRLRLLRISASTFTIVSLGTWAATIGTSLLLRATLPEAVGIVVAALEAFLLVVFAVALENLFVQMLGFPGGFGSVLRRTNRWVWLGGLIAVTFLFLHTLVNPRGDLAQAVQGGNVIVLLRAVGAFVACVFALRLVLWLRERQAARRGKTGSVD